MKNNIAAGIAQIKSEGSHPWIFFTPQSQLDNFTDSIMLQQSQRTSDWNAVTAYFTNEDKWPYLKSNSQHNPLYAAFANQGYPRYWHGYTVLLKPLLVFLNYNAIRIVSFVVLAFLLCVAFDEVRKRFGLISGFCFVATLALINIFVVPMSLVFSPVIYITLCSVCLLRVFDTHNYRILAFTVIGAFTNYVDFLTFPLLTLCVPLIFCMMHDILYESMNLSHRLLSVICSSVMWLVAYASTWIMKWVVSSLIIRENVISDAIYNIMVRSDTGGVNESRGMTFNKADIILGNYTLLLSNLPKKVCLLIFITVIIIAYFKLRKRGFSLVYLIKRTINASPILLIGFAPIVWYCVLANHSAIHMEFYAYKNSSITILSILMFFVLVLYPAKEKTNYISHTDDVKE